MMTIYNFVRPLIICAGLCFAITLQTAHAGIPEEAGMYQFLLADTLVNAVKQRLESEGLATSAVNISADDQGVVTLDGTVDSPAQAKEIPRLVKGTPGVYAVLGALRYPEAAGDLAQ